MPAETHPLEQLCQTLNSCSHSINLGDHRNSEAGISELVQFLNSISESDDIDSNANALELLSELHTYISSPTLDQEVVDALSFELPKEVAKFSGASSKLLEVAESVIDQFILRCSPRDMLPILCEALDSSISNPGYFAPLLSGLAKVILYVQRRHFEQMKEVVPVVVNVLKAISSESDVEDTDFVDLFSRTISVANSIQTVCKKLDGRVNDKLRALLGLFVLQIMVKTLHFNFRAFVSINLKNKAVILALVQQLSNFYLYCGLSFLGLVSGSDIDRIVNTFLEGKFLQMMEMIISDVFPMSSLEHLFQMIDYSVLSIPAVIWGHISSDVAVAAGEDMTLVNNELRVDRGKRWQAVGMLKDIFSSFNLSWELKKYAVDFLHSIMGGDNPGNYNDAHLEGSCHFPGLLAALEALEKAIIYAPDGALRKDTFAALKMVRHSKYLCCHRFATSMQVLADVPTSLRFDILSALIRNSSSSSMTAVLIGCFKDEMHKESCQRIASSNEPGRNESETPQTSNFWSPSVLELVELVLRPNKGGPPALPEHSDEVLSALNLYRFVLLTESAAETNHTGVLSKSSLQKAYNEWLLPLRTLVTGIIAENKDDYDQFAMDTVCALNPVELVLYCCLELVEEKLSNSP
ncbi:YAP-binding/ALF4/Glomulin [Dillenia turbinata]|uniref:YAP-binding/ALF4/Glomulin n=1 Tax=Dillenia turbinata TaxID=194707 RepID=A0AAN8V6G5_9MAGN